ncbi:tyrosine kinase, putative [Entamoeba nuttalli P19]|uniref:Tyrosine kinase, putative n=1 Tax=Entamoeba nuttalli (strain P19) TaxID=1076696 RepID=K2GVQ6_ENTNP|nr:tyrosine kinase, putative [Entamoeba nuttalli P19]EKE39168.1 tyrosine kinase, putative [Entamoeba nuttalli P19]|eukprot:XP_008858495.1 tyrosine kinase, putative [Entamoeba nuttalli P19]
MVITSVTPLINIFFFICLTNGCQCVIYSNTQKLDKECSYSGDGCDYILYGDWETKFQGNDILSFGNLFVYSSVTITSQYFMTFTSLQLNSNVLLTVNGNIQIKGTITINKGAKIIANGQWHLLGSMVIYPNNDNIPLFEGWRCNNLQLDKKMFNIIIPTSFNGCIDIFSLMDSSVLNNDSSSNDYKSTDFPILGNTLQLVSNQRLIRYCSSSISFDYSVKCHMNGTIYKSSLSLSDYSYPFTFPHCPCEELNKECSLIIDVDYANFQFINLPNTNIYSSHSLIILSLIKIKELYFYCIKCSIKIQIIKECNFIQFGNKLQLSDLYSSNFLNVKFTYNYTSLINTISIDNFFKRGQATLTISDNAVVESILSLNNINLTIESLKEVIILIQSINSSIKSISGRYVLITNTAMIINQNQSINNCHVIECINEICYCLICFEKYKLMNKTCIEEGVIPSGLDLVQSIYSNCIWDLFNVKTNERVCILCDPGYILHEGNCLIESDCLVAIVNRCVQCSFGYLNTSFKCQECNDNNCEFCTNTKCLECLFHSYINQEECVFDSNKKNKFECKDGYYLSFNKCISCLSFDSHCILCEKERCKRCENGYFISDGKCVLEQNCNVIQNGICQGCNGNKILDINHHCVEPINNCILYNGNECIKCEDLMYFDGISCALRDEHCQQYYQGMPCRRCKDTYYLTKQNTCHICEKCQTCSSENYCLTCNSTSFLSNRKCRSNNELIGKCNIFTPIGGCSLCKDGYFLNEFDCIKCPIECKTCFYEQCLTCADDYYQHYNGSCLSKNTLQGCAVEITQFGCTQCKDGFFHDVNTCEQCNGTCRTCNEYNECTSCNEELVFSRSRCISLEGIDHCKIILQSKCQKCSFWYRPSDDGTYCSSYIVWWLVMLMIIFIFCIFVVTLIFFYCIINRYQHFLVQHHQHLHCTIFKIKESSINFKYRINKWIQCNCDILLLEGHDIVIKVQQPCVSYFYLGNFSSSLIKIQIVLNKKNGKFLIKIDPAIILLKKGEACKFKLTVTPLCSSKLNNKITIVCQSINSGKEEVGYLKFKGETEITTKLDIDEIIFDNKIGEGTSGIVFKGRFREHIVAIKDMKDRSYNIKIKEEFEKEVSMLDKFRSDYIIYFYGSVLFKNKRYLITEYAEHGSIRTLFSLKKETIPIKLRIKFMIDAANGIQYLHVNGILHRDIKPDNILVLFLSEDVQINCKLTDFGSSRNINTLMTNMTFTKGIGTPVYMAPELLTKEYYKKEADIYSFAITMYECFKWGDAYDKEKFVYIWNIAEFVISGKRLQQVNEIPDSVYKLICDCWKQNPKDRLVIEQVLDRLQLLYKVK